MISALFALCSLMFVFGSYQSPDPLKTPEVVTDSSVRKSNKKNTKSYTLPIGKLLVDPKVWTKSIESNVPGAALELVHDEGDAFLAVVTSADFIPSNDFIKAFVDGMSTDDSDVKNATLSLRKVITVNGQQLTDITVTAVVTGQNFVYRGYLYTGRKGVSLVLIWTHADLYRELLSDIEQVLDGYVAK